MAPARLPAWAFPSGSKYPVHIKGSAARRRAADFDAYLVTLGGWCGHRAVIVQVGLVQGNIRGTMILCTSLADCADIGRFSGDLYGKSPRGAHVDVQVRHVHRVHPVIGSTDSPYTQACADSLCRGI